MTTLSLCIVGAGSSYTPELVEGLLALPPAELPVESLNLTDIDAGRLRIMAGLSERMVRRSGRAVRVRSDTRLEPMLEGASFVITQIRVGGMAGRQLDESIPLSRGLLGQETTGAGGMCKALRTIPPMLEIARTVERVAPDAFLLNYTNPSGIITEAVTRHTGARIIGLCSGVPGLQRGIARRLAGRYPDLRTYCVGLNHLAFIHRIVSQGRDVTREAIAQILADERAASGDRASPSWELAGLLDAVPISYVLYYANRGRMVREAQSQPRTRAQTVAALEREILAEAADPATDSKPRALAERGGGGYSDVTFAMMKAIHHGTGEELVANVPNRGAVEQIDDDAVVEVVCRVDRSGPAPLPVGKVPLAFRGLVLAVKAYESLTVEAAVRKDRRLALQALMNHPLLGDIEDQVPMLDEMLAAHGLELR